MMLNKNDQERVTQLLTDAITVLCKNGLSYESQFCIEGLLGITLDEREVFLVKIDETVRGHGASGSESEEYKSPAGISHQRTAVTSPRMRGARPRGRPLVTSRGRFSSFGNRKRNLFGGAAKPPGAGVPNVSNAQSAVSRGGGEPPSKVRLQGEATPSTTPAQDENFIEIGDEDSKSPHGRISGSDIKTEPPDFPNTMPADSTQGPDSKYTLDNETSKSLTHFLDNLMTAHGARNERGDSSTSQSASSSSPAAAGSSALSHLAQMASPKSEPPSWDQQQYSSSMSGSSPMSQPQQMMPYSWNLERMGFLTRPEARVVKESPEGQMIAEAKYSPNRGSTMPQIRGRRKSNAVRKHFKPVVNSDVSSNAFVSMTYTCKQCRQTFTTQTGLQNHIYVKHKDVNTKPFPCDQCHKAFLHSATLLRHKKEEHLGIYRHVCQVCGKGYTNKSDLRGHLVSHGGQQDYHCDMCQRSFTYKKVYKAHMTNVHNLQE